MKVLVTGSAGFIGKNLVEHLRSGAYPEVTEVLEFTLETPDELLDQYCRECDFVFHLAGVNRPTNEAEFTTGNVDFTARLLDALRRGSRAPVLISSSTQAVLDNPYGLSKRAAEDALFEYSIDTGAPVFAYRLPGVFGKWSQPNYNSVVATFCHNIARDLPVTVNDPAASITLVYIDDLVREFTAVMGGQVGEMDDEGCYYIPVAHQTTVGEIADMLREFKRSRETLAVPRMDDPFTKKLYSTYLSYLPTDAFSYPLEMHADARGSFTEIIRTAERGQFSVNITKPGITKGNHWHNTKNEKFVVVSGTGVIRFRKVGEDAVLEYPVSGDRIEVVDIPPGYTHTITNVGGDDLIAFIWGNECFNPDDPDTYPLDV
ncbi:MAG: NAD-dependent epimerase/dehydratase family protein [Coriobacteriia bacterium]|nr:NAD-dependent epimerase/dehydratase family protein [Coriobacteriia bacterium]